MSAPSRPIPAAFDWTCADIAYRRDLPHVVQDDALYFVTFRLHDSVPREQLRMWRWEIAQWHKANPPPHTPEQEQQFAALGYRRTERWLDRHTGSCILADDRCHKIIISCMTKFDGQHLWLGDYTIMPNHLHALLQIANGDDLKTILKSWYGTTTHQINKALGRRGTLWQPDPFDHIVRDEVSLQRIRNCIQNNGQHLTPGRYHYDCGKLFQ